MNLVMVIIFYITFIDIIQKVGDSTLLKKLSNINIEPTIEAIDEIDIGSFIHMIVDLTKKVSQRDISEFIDGMEMCIINQCSKQPYQ